MVVRLTRVEVGRLLRRARFWLVLLLVGVSPVVPAVRAGLNPLAYAVPVAPGEMLYPCQYATGIIVTYLSIPMLLPVVLPFVVCDTFPNDRKGKYVVLLRSRGATATRLVVSRVLANFVVAAVAVLVVFSFLLAAAVLSASQIHGKIGPASSFLPELLESNPATYFLLTLTAVILGCAGTLAIGVLAGALTRSWLVAVLLPALVVLVGLFLPLPDWLQAYNPAGRATFLYFSTEWANPQSTAFYWLVMTTVLALAAIFAYRRAEGA